MENKFLRFVEYVKLSFWDTKRYLHNISIGLNQGTLLSDVLKPYKKSVSKEEIIKNGWQIISKINFGGELFLREFEEIEKYKGNLFLVPENTIIYSKINVRHGCIYFNEIDNIPFCVSSEYPVFVIDENKVKGKFLQRLLRTNEFKKLLNTKATGISKARVKQDEFLNIQIPLPSLDEQEAIVSAYQSKIEEAQRLENEAQELENEIENYLFEELGIEQEQQKKGKTRGLQFVEFKNVEKWGVDFVFNIEKEKNKYKVYKISDLCKISSGGTPSRSRKEYFTGNIPWIKTGELNNEILFDTEEKITEHAIQNSSAKLYPIGSLVVAMYGATIGKTAKLGVEATTNQACAVLFDIDTSKVEIDFLWEFIQSQTNKFKSLAYGSAQPNLNAGIISNYKVPLPPPPKQNEIVATIATMKQTQKQKTETVTRLRAEALAEFEKVIFS
ncbi:MULTISPECIES: restriction endonuclease subunit S [Capnocytophaga]|uniref:restriction endonuclease subunit S n=1 Tax=Capnocytophaga TaxID=1016 RepID=UPI001EE38331|nr:restriction endonuclease subunit S [Capnocytophaga cynodegmi]